MLRTTIKYVSDLNALRSLKLEDFRKLAFDKSNINELDSLFSVLEEKKIEYLKEFINTLHKTDISMITDEIKKITWNIDQSLNSFKNLSQHIWDFLFDPFSPEIDIDEDGELVLEWYGRLGARANLTFSRNGEMYFISMFHGQHEKMKLFANQQNAGRINDSLVKLFYDKTL